MRPVLCEKQEFGLAYRLKRTGEAKLLETSKRREWLQKGKLDLPTILAGYAYGQMNYGTVCGELRDNLLPFA